MPTTVIHVKVLRDGTWIVEHDGRAISRHQDAAAATAAAADHADAIGGGDIVLRDCYDHIHETHHPRPVRQPRQRA